MIISFANTQNSNRGYQLYKCVTGSVMSGLEAMRYLWAPNYLTQNETFLVNYYIEIVSKLQNLPQGCLHAQKLF